MIKSEFTIVFTYKKGKMPLFNNKYITNIIIKKNFILNNFIIYQ